MVDSAFCKHHYPFLLNHKIAWLVVTEPGNQLLLCVKRHRLDKLQNGVLQLFNVLFLESKTGLCMKKEEKERPCCDVHGIALQYEISLGWDQPNSALLYAAFECRS